MIVNVFDQTYHKLIEILCYKFFNGNLCNLTVVFFIHFHRAKFFMEIAGTLLIYAQVLIVLIQNKLIKLNIN